jgi:Fe-S-cluster containining protein
MKGECLIYDNRPDFCRAWPFNLRKPSIQIGKLENCSYKVVNEQVTGTCCKCGECCVNIPWNNEGTELDFFAKTDKVCRYLDGD